MSSGSGRRLLALTVTSYAAGGAALAAAGAWLFAELLSFTALRNANHYLLDYRIHRLQAVPWGCIVIGLLALPVAACGWAGARRRRAGGALAAHVALLAVLIPVYAALAGLVFAYVDESSTEEFVKDTVYDGFYSAKTDEAALAAFGRLERRLGCCGANDARDYRNWREAPPPTCCADDVVCDFASREANDRVGCSRVTAARARHAALWLAAGAALSALLQLGALACTCYLLLRPRPVEKNIEMESTKTLLYEKPV